MRLPRATIDFTVGNARTHVYTAREVWLFACLFAWMRTAVERYGVLSGGMETFERIAGYLER